MTQNLPKSNFDFSNGKKTNGNSHGLTSASLDAMLDLASADSDSMQIEEHQFKESPSEPPARKAPEFKPLAEAESEGQGHHAGDHAGDAARTANWRHLLLFGQPVSDEPDYRSSARQYGRSA